MKTTMPVHRPSPAATLRQRSHRRWSTLRLGVVVSLVAVVLVIVVEAVVQVPAILVLVPVVVVGFALSWHASAPPHR